MRKNPLSRKNKMSGLIFRRLYAKKQTFKIMECKYSRDLCKLTPAMRYACNLIRFSELEVLLRPYVSWIEM